MIASRSSACLLALLATTVATSKAHASTVILVSDFLTGLVGTSNQDVGTTKSSTLDPDDIGPFLSETLSERTGCSCDVFSNGYWQARARSSQLTDLISGQFSLLQQTDVVFAPDAPLPEAAANSSYEVDTIFRTQGRGELTFDGYVDVALFPGNAASDLTLVSSSTELFFNIQYPSGGSDIESGKFPSFSFGTDELVQGSNITRPFSITADLRDDARINFETVVQDNLRLEGQTPATFEGFLQSSRASLLTTVQITDVRTSPGVVFAPGDPTLFASVERSPIPAPVPLPAGLPILAAAFGSLFVLRYARGRASIL